MQALRCSHYPVLLIIKALCICYCHVATYTNRRSSEGIFAEYIYVVIQEHMSFMEPFSELLPMCNVTTLAC
jgi:hypothetical protein